MAAPLPLAAGLDWLEGILPLVFLLFWIVSQVRALFRGADPGKPPVPPLPRRRAPQRPAIGEAQEDLSRQIEEFIRRSAAGRQAAPPSRLPRGRDNRPLFVGGRERIVTPSRGPTSPRPASRGALAGEAKQPSLGSLGGHATDVARHVREAFSREIEHLPAGLAASEATGAAAEARGPAAAELIAALRDPATLRQMVLIREVLDRPVERW